MNTIYKNRYKKEPVLTDRQMELFKFIALFIKKNHYPPTLRELMNKMSIKSTNGIRVHLTALEKKRFIRRKKGMARSIVILKEVTDG